MAVAANWGYGEVAKVMRTKIRVHLEDGESVEVSTGQCPEGVRVGDKGCVTWWTLDGNSFWVSFQKMSSP